MLIPGIGKSQIETGESWDLFGSHLASNVVIISYQLVNIALSIVAHTSYTLHNRSAQCTFKTISKHSAHTHILDAHSTNNAEQ